MNLWSRKKIVFLFLAALLLLVGSVWFFSRNNNSESRQFLTAMAARQELRVVVSTNGVIEPIDRADIYAPIDGFVSQLLKQEGSQVARGQLLMRLESGQLKTSLAEAQAALLESRRAARPVLAGPSQEELAAVEASIAEAQLQVKQLRENCEREEKLLKQDATSRFSVETLREQLSLAELRLGSVKQKKQDLLERFSAEEKQWMQTKIGEQERQVRLLEQQLQSGVITAPRNGVIYSLPVKVGAYVSRGQLLAQVYEPGQVRLRAYVDEPDLGRIQRGQQVVVEWDGLPEKRWTAKVEQPAEQVVTLGSRSVGYVVCTLEGSARELIPNINIKVQIVTARKPAALVIPRGAVFNRNGQPTVMLLEGTRTLLRPVSLGLVTPQETEILQGIEEGNKVVINPGESANP